MKNTLKMNENSEKKVIKTLQNPDAIYIDSEFDTTHNYYRKHGSIRLNSFGKIMKVALEAAEVLEKENISCEIIDLRTVRPIDYACVVESIKKTNRCVVVEESWPLASISSEIAYHLQRYAFDYLDAPVLRVTQTDTPFAFSPTLIEEALPNVERIVKAVKSTLYRD